MKKSIALLIVAILVLPALTFVSPVMASTGHPKLGYTNTAMDTLWLANLNVTLKAGDVNLVYVDAASPAASPALFAIVFNATGYEGVDFSGQVFDLYMSRDGYSSLSADDKMYASGFSVADLDSALKAVNKTNALLKGGAATFYIGTIDDTQVLVGPIPFDITNDYNYVKIFDGTGTLVAVGGFIEVLPSISITPDYGPGGAYICMSGVALAPNAMYRIYYQGEESAAATVTTGADGKFNFCWNVKDLCNDCDGEYETITIELYTNATTPVFVDSVTFDEYSRVFYVGDFGWLYCNNSWIDYDVYVFDELYINGSYWNPTSPVVITVDGITLGTVTPDAEGMWEITVTIPALSLGIHNVTMTNAGCKWLFSIDVNPTLFVTPEKGPIGTNVLFTCYGFEPNTMYYLYWEELCFGDDLLYNIVNATTGADGQFNVTVPFTVPAQYGGPHWIYAHVNYQGAEVDTSDFFYSNYTADTTFFVTPTMVISPNTFSNDGTTFWINITGAFVFYERDTTTDHYLPPYNIDIDNQEICLGSPGHISADECGVLDIQLVKAGFRPGLHVATMYFWCQEIDYDLEDGYDSDYEFLADYWLPGFIAPIAYATFTVTTEGDLVVGDITDFIDAQLVSIEGDIATIKTDVGTLKTSVTALDAKVVALQGSVATIQTTLGTLSGTVTTISGDMATVKTQVGTINANVAAMKPFLPVDMMPVWIAVIFAIIAAIASIYGVLVIRSKIAQ